MSGFSYPAFVVPAIVGSLAVVDNMVPAMMPVFMVLLFVMGMMSVADVFVMLLVMRVARIPAVLPAIVCTIVRMRVVHCAR